jgi:hypothetical protein
MSPKKVCAIKIVCMILFFLVLPLPAIAAEEMSPVQDQGGITIANLRLLLNSFAALGEGYVENVLRDLKVISVTEEVKSGEWENMRGILAEVGRSGIKAAAVWFVRPDGSYYTVEKGLTDQNLSDHQYFPRLMAGEEIRGDLVISKSTGKRTAIVAVPIKKNGKIIGALGTSLAVEDMSSMLDGNMGLPGNMIFYALDQKGQTALHRVSTLLFAYPSDMGSKSLAKTVGEMLVKPEGEVTYNFYGERTVVYKKAPLTGWVFAIGIVTGKPGPGADLPPILSELGNEITAELNKVDQDAAKVARRLSGKDFTTAETRKMLGDLCGSYFYAVDCAVVDRNGRMVMVEPEAYAGFEGSDISAQEQIIRLHETKKPVLSNVIRAVEGIEAVDLEHPVFSSQGEFAGSVSALIRPESLLSHVLTPVLRGMPIEAFVMQTDGRILYDEDKDEVGRMLFDDPIYKPFPQLLAVVTMARREKTGSGTYDFRQKGSEKLVKKDAYWTTVGLHGTEWRLVVMHVRAGHAIPPGKDLGNPGTDSYQDALRRLAENAELKRALYGNDDAGIRDIFRTFYSEHDGLYSIQWVDSQGTNRYGYPEENSLINFDMKTSKTASAKPMLRALSDKKESTFDCPLVEGEIGTFFMIPVYEGAAYLGMIYTIRIRE